MSVDGFSKGSTQGIQSATYYPLISDGLNAIGWFNNSFESAIVKGVRTNYSLAIATFTTPLAVSLGVGFNDPNSYINVSYVFQVVSSGIMPTYTIGTAQSLTPQYLFNINTILNFMNTVLNNVNFNVSTKIQFLQSELNNTNLNITTKINR